MKALLGDLVLAEAPQDDLIKIEENWYFPPSSLDSANFAESSTAYHCPWKGDARYFDVGSGATALADGAWSYPRPIKASFVVVGADYSGYVAFDPRITLVD